MKTTLDSGAHIPVRKHTFDAGADLHSNTCAVIQPGKSMEFDTGVHVAIPESCVGIVKGRSGLAFNHSIVAHEGTIDYGYTGSIKVLLFNLGDKPYTVKREDRIAQLLIQPVVLVPFELVEKLERTERGSKGFGSTGR
jgi:dUTP pyrophosphatase